MAKIPMQPPSPGQMHRAMEKLVTIKDRLLAVDPDMAADDKLFADMLEGEDNDNALAVIDRMVRAAIDAEDMAVAAKERAARVKQREARFRQRSEAIRGVVLDALQTLDQVKLEREDFTVSVGKGRSHVIITDETKLPGKFKRRIPATTEPDKVLIGKALADGKPVAGAVLSNPEPTLTIRTR